MKPTKEEIIKAYDAMANIKRFFPSELQGCCDTIQQVLKEKMEAKE